MLFQRIHEIIFLKENPQLYHMIYEEFLGDSHFCLKKKFNSEAFFLKIEILVI